MNIDISNAHCGPRIQFPDHAWLRVVYVPKNCLRRSCKERAGERCLNGSSARVVCLFAMIIGEKRPNANRRRGCVSARCVRSGTELKSLREKREEFAAAVAEYTERALRLLPLAATCRSSHTRRATTPWPRTMGLLALSSSVATTHRRCIFLSAMRAAARRRTSDRWTLAEVRSNVQLPRARIEDASRAVARQQPRVCPREESGRERLNLSVV